AVVKRKTRRAGSPTYALWTGRRISVGHATSVTAVVKRKTRRAGSPTYALWAALGCTMAIDNARKYRTGGAV
ncbi:hypothetical protein, partial [Caldilinea sp.]|uniref:hypothetical protein n=1 Tax=Caldilinea sp. TaxID=2293560 RepID=UPI002B927714|nr:hypothetical protein [Caldilinea sp.]